MLPLRIDWARVKVRNTARGVAHIFGGMRALRHVSDMNKVLHGRGVDELRWRR